MHYKKSGFMVEDYDFIVIVTRFRNLIVILLLWKIFHRHVRVARASPLVRKKIRKLMFDEAFMEFNMLRKLTW